MGSCNMQEDLNSILFWAGDGQFCRGFQPLCKSETRNQTCYRLNCTFELAKMQFKEMQLHRIIVCLCAWVCLSVCVCVCVRVCHATHHGAYANGIRKTREGQSIAYAVVSASTSVIHEVTGAPTCSCHTYKWVRSHVRMSHGTFTDASYHCDARCSGCAQLPHEKLTNLSCHT